MTRGQRTKLLAEQTRLLPQLDALLRRAAGWIDPPGAGVAALPDAPTATRRTRRAPSPRAPVESDGATAAPQRADASAAPATAPTRAGLPRMIRTRIAASTPDATRVAPASPTAAPMFRLRLPVRRAAPVLGRVARATAPIAPVAVSAPQTTPIPPGASGVAPTRSAPAGASMVRAATTALPTAAPSTRRVAPSAQADSTGGAWSALDRFAAWPWRGTPDIDPASRAAFARVENTDPFADAALEDRLEAILQRALAETGLDPT
jgi:hypothetical protein